MAVDRREDPGEFYPDGKVISTRPVATGGDVKHSDFADVEPLPERFTDEDVRMRFNQLVSAAKGASAAVVALLLGAAAFGAGVTVQTAPKGTIYNDEHIVTGVVFNATGLATPEMVTNIVQDVSPAPDFSTNNVELVKTIEAKAPIPTWDTLSGKPTFAPVATSGAYSDLSGKPTIPTTAADVGAVSTNGATMTGALVMEAPIVIRGAGLAGVQFSDTVLYVLDENGLPSRSLTYSEIAQTSDIPTSMAWGSITGKPTTISGYGITDALSADDLSSAISATNTVFSNAVLSVGLNIDTNTVAAINALVEQGEELPIGGATTVGALLLALAAAIAALKRDKADKVANATAGNLATLTAQGNLADAGYHFEVRGGIPCIVQYT